MVCHYSTKSFSRQMPNVQLAHYIERKGLFAEIDFAAMKEGKPHELFKAWLVIPNTQHNLMDAEL